MGGGQDSYRKCRYLKTSRTHLDFNGDDHRDELFIQLPHHHQLLQRQTAEPADGQTDTQSLRLAG